MRNRYKALNNGKDLKTLLKKELSGSLEDIMCMLVMAFEEMEAKILYDATKGLGTAENLIIPVKFI